MSAEILSTIPITKEVAAVDDQIKVLDDEIAELDKRKEEIEKLKEELGKARIAALAQTAPINRMLPELLGRIFEYAANESEKEGIDVPLNLVLVSHLWRKVALETPRAWWRIAIEIEDESSARPMTRRARAFLERSTAIPIDVFLDVLSWGQSEDRPHLFKDILDALEPNLSRCTRLICRLREENDSQLVLSRLAPHFGPTLEEFSVESRDSVRLQMPTMPHLAKLSLDDMGPRDGWTIDLLKNLRSLSLRYFKPIAFEPFLLALEAAKDVLEELRLSRCTLAFDSYTFMFFTTERRPVFPKLKTIGMTDIQVGDIDIFFESVHAPALENLFLGMDSARFRYFKFMDPATATCLSNCPLKRVELEDGTIEGSDLRSLLALLRSVSGTLQEISIGGGELDTRFFHAMRVEPSIVPNLRSLTIKRQSEFTGHDLIKIARARMSREGITPLEVIGVEKCRSYEHDVGDDLKRMGIKFEFIPY
ncbi:hypothetical protein FRB91_008058 [Serendipita sp. 411]|nr:hypothetical protein FRC18_009237 [Serendipita sp. 400]KAG8851352.1 hypothetical protein FRB91_008058 [Serendipita sp. 411]